VTVAAAAQTSGSTPNDFTNPVVYTVSAADASTATYTVTVSVAANSAKAITAYSLVGVSGTIAGSAISVTMPFGTDVTALIATFTTTGASVTVAAAAQTSGSTPNDFTSPVVYTVTAADATTATYTVTVTVSASPNLKGAASFAVLAGTTLTNNSGATTTAVTGDVGATGVSGSLIPVTGNYYPLGSETAYVNAMADLPSVISDANNAVLFPCGTSIATIGTLNPTPGVYCINADAAITGVVTLTLNNPGVYIFRTAGALTPDPGSSVAFGGTATPANTNVFWVVGSADMGTPGASWKGTILTNGAVTLGDGDTLLGGRVLSNAAVTLSNNQITIP
jgi:hypothetical protein